MNDYCMPDQWHHRTLGEWGYIHTTKPPPKKTKTFRWLSWRSISRFSNSFFVVVVIVDWMSENEHGIIDLRLAVNRFLPEWCTTTMILRHEHFRGKSFLFSVCIDMLNVDVIADLILMEHFSDYRWMSPPSVKAISIVSTTPNAWTVSVSAGTVSSLKEPLASMSTNAPNRLADPTPSAPIWPAVIVANAKPVSSANPQLPRAKVSK